MKSQEEEKNGKTGKARKKKYGRDKRYPGIRWYDSKKGRVFYLYYKDAQGKQHETRVGYEAEGWSAKLVHEKRWEIIQEIERGKKRKVGIRTFKDAVDLLFRRYELEGKKGIAQERSRLRWFCNLYDKHFEAVLSEPILLGVIKKMKDAGQSGTSVYHVLDLYRRVVYEALKIDGCPVQELDRHFKKALQNLLREYKPDPRGKTETLTKSQLKTLVKVLEIHSDRYHGNIMKLALFTGMRRGNILKLEWEDVDFDREIIILRAEKTKGKKYDTEIPMNGKAREALEEMRRLRDEALERLEALRVTALNAPEHSRLQAERDFLLAWRGCRYAVKEKWPPEAAPERIAEVLRSPVKGSPFVFPGRDGGQRKEIRKGIEKIRKAANLPEGFRPLHGLRHVYGTLLAQENAPFVVKELLGHASTETTKRYVDLLDETKKKAADGMAKTVFKIVNGDG